MKKKLNLGDLKVQSFVTTMDQQESYTAKGGANSVPCINTLVLCNSRFQSCVSGCQSCPECPETV